MLTLDEARLSQTALLTNPRRYLDRLNFATNFAFFRDADGLSTRLVTANYWAGYGAWPGAAVAAPVRRRRRRARDLGGDACRPGPAASRSTARRCASASACRQFTGQLFIHAIGVAGHDVVKYALDTYGVGQRRSLSVHPRRQRLAVATAMPACRRRAPTSGWCCGCRTATPPRSPPAPIALDRMGASAGAARTRPVGPFRHASPLDVAELLPGLHWPAQVELRSRPPRRAPALRGDARRPTRIAHVNVERANLRPDPAIATLPTRSAAATCCRSRSCRADRFRSIVQPTPMADAQDDLPLRLDVFDPEGATRARALPRLPATRPRASRVDLDALDAPRKGHAELVYDFRDGGEADGWLHALFRYEDARQRARGREQLRRAYLQHGDDVSRRAAIVFRPAARPVHPPVPQAGRWRPAQLRRADLRRRPRRGIRIRAPRCICTTPSGRLIAETAAFASPAPGSATGVSRTRLRRPTCSQRAGPRRLRAGPRPDLPAVRLSWADGRCRRVLARPHVRVLTAWAAVPSYRPDSYRVDFNGQAGTPL